MAVLLSRRHWRTGNRTVRMARGRQPQTAADLRPFRRRGCEYSGDSHTARAAAVRLAAIAAAAAREEIRSISAGLTPKSRPAKGFLALSAEHTRAGREI